MKHTNKLKNQIDSILISNNTLTQCLEYYLIVKDQFKDRKSSINII